MNPSSPIDVVYERQWSSLGNVIKALTGLGRMGRLYGGFPKFRYTQSGIPAEIIRTFPFAALWNHAAGRLHLPASFQLEEPRWVGNWVAKHKDLAPTVWANGTAHRFLFPKLKKVGRTLILERGSSHPEPFYLLQQQARKEAGFTFNSEQLPQAVIDEVEKNKLADFLIAGSEMIREGYVERGFPADRAFNCSYGIDPSQFPYIQRSTKVEQVIKIGIVGIIGFRKGLLRALRLGEWARRRGLLVELHFVGPVFDHESRQMLRATSANVVLHGVRKGPQLLELLHAFDVYMLPSYEDGFGISVIEAMATGLPAIVSTNTGAKEAIQHGLNGWCLESFDSEEFDEHLLSILKNPENLKEMGIHAHQNILANYTSDHYYQRINAALAAISAQLK
jgi:glycosyltransferase involved in cell wall biosynthesis